MKNKGNDEDFLLASNEERRRWMNGKQLWVENVIESIVDSYGIEHIIQSTASKANNNEVKEGKRIFEKTGKCKHPVFYDTAGWMYDDRWCGICGTHTGLI